MTIHRLIFKSRNPQSTDLWYAEVNEETSHYRHIYHDMTTPENAWHDIAVHNFRNDHPEFAQSLLDSCRGGHETLSRHWGYVAYFVPDGQKVYRSGLTKFLEEKCNVSIQTG